MKKLLILTILCLIACLPASAANTTTVCSAIAISAFTGSSGTLTFTTGTQHYTSGLTLYLTGFSGGNTGLNGQTVTILSAGLNTTHFEAAVTGSGYSTGSGTATNIYGNIECTYVMSTIAGNCGSALTVSDPVLINDYVGVWVGNSGAGTPATGVTINLTSSFTSVLAGLYYASTWNESFWGNVMTVNGTITGVTAACSGNPLDEITVFSLRSIVGTVAVDAVSTYSGPVNWKEYSNVDTGITAGTTSTKANDLGIFIGDWATNNPTATAPCTNMDDNEGNQNEYNTAIYGLGAAGAYSCTWTSGGLDAYIVGFVAFRDGAPSGASGGGGFGGTAGIGGKAGVGE